MCFDNKIPACITCSLLVEILLHLWLNYHYILYILTVALCMTLLVPVVVGGIVVLFRDAWIAQFKRGPYSLNSVVTSKKHCVHSDRHGKMHERCTPGMVVILPYSQRHQHVIHAMCIRTLRQSMLMLSQITI